MGDESETSGSQVLEMSALDLVILTDTLHGSLCVKDGGGLWKFSHDQRLELLQRLYASMEGVPVEATSDKSS